MGTTHTPALKGFGYGRDSDLADQQRAALKLLWWYGWSASCPSTQPDQALFVPQVWGGGNVPAALATVKQELVRTKATHLLGFNEPDFDQQSNMTVAKAASLWPLLEETGLRLGAPATIKPTSTWLYQFMDEVDRLNLRVDFLPVHIYGWPDSDDFLGKLEDLHARYGLPIWVTEFAVADFKATTKQNNRYTIDQVLAFMAETVAGMRAMPFVERFSWKTRDVNDPEMWVSALFQDDGTLTSRGRAYAGL